jgi:hypothetical protein
VPEHDPWGGPGPTTRLRNYASTGSGSDFATAESIAVALTRTQDALPFGGYAAALVIGTALLYRRDTD